MEILAEERYIAVNVKFVRIHNLTLTIGYLPLLDSNFKQGI
jgi:hypothetical protein